MNKKTPLKGSKNRGGRSRHRLSGVNGVQRRIDPLKAISEEGCGVIQACNACFEVKKCVRGLCCDCGRRKRRKERKGKT